MLLKPDQIRNKKNMIKQMSCECAHVKWFIVKKKYIYPLHYVGTFQLVTFQYHIWSIIKIWIIFCTNGTIANWILI